MVSNREESEWANADTNQALDPSVEPSLSGVFTVRDSERKPIEYYRRPDLEPIEPSTAKELYPDHKMGAEPRVQAELLRHVV
jgi:hypothetical protein